MKKRLKKTLVPAGAAALLALSMVAKAQTVEAVVGLELDNPRAFYSAMEEMFESGALDGYDIRVWVNAFDGANPATHTLVGMFDDYESHQELTRQRLDHRGWVEFLLAVEGVSVATSNSMAVELFKAGELQDDHRSIVAFIMTVTDPAAYAPALTQLTEDVGHPGSLRLMQLRFGGDGASHAALLSAPDSVAMNEYLDELISSDEYAEFVDDVSDIRTIQTVNYYALARHWRR